MARELADELEAELADELAAELARDLDDKLSPGGSDSRLSTEVGGILSDGDGDSTNLDIMPSPDDGSLDDALAEPPDASSPALPPQPDSPPQAASAAREHGFEEDEGTNLDIEPLAGTPPSKRVSTEFELDDADIEFEATGLTPMPDLVSSQPQVRPASNPAAKPGAAPASAEAGSPQTTGGRAPSVDYPGPNRLPSALPPPPAAPEPAVPQAIPQATDGRPDTTVPMSGPPAAMLLHQARGQEEAVESEMEHPVYPGSRATPGGGAGAPAARGLPGLPGVASPGQAQPPAAAQGAVPTAEPSGPWSQPSGPWSQSDAEAEVLSSTPPPRPPPVARNTSQDLVSDMVSDIVGDSGDALPGPVAVSGTSNPADGLDPSPEYIAAREAALQAVRAQKEIQRTSGPQPVASYPQASESAHDLVAMQQRSQPAAQPLGQRPGDLNRSYTDALAALDVPEDRAVPGQPGAVPNKGSLIAIYDDDDGIPASPMADEANILTTPVSSWAPLPQGHVERQIAERTASGARPLTARQAAKRARGPAPGRTFAKLPIERNAVRMGIGLFAIAAGLVLLLWFLPNRTPITPEERAAGKALIERSGRPMRADIYQGGQLAAGGFVLVGLLFIVNGYFFKPKDEVVCKRCKRYVIAQRDFTVLKCPRSSHTARMCTKTVLLTLLLVACVGGTFFAIALGSIVRAI